MSISALTWKFDVPDIPGVTRAVLRGIGFTREDTNFILELNPKTINLIGKFSSFVWMEDYIVRRIREYIGWIIYKILLWKELTIRCTSIELDIWQWFDLNIRWLGDKKKHRYCDITESYRRYQEKKNGKNISIDNTLLIHIPHGLISYCYQQLLKTEYSQEELGNKITELVEDYWMKNAEKISVYDKLNSTEYTISINQL